MKLTKLLIKILILSAFVFLIFFFINQKIEENKEIMHKVNQEIETLQALKFQVDETLLELTKQRDKLDIVYKYAESYSIPPEVILAVMKVESNFNPNVISSTQDYGIMQINKTNLKHLDNKLDSLDLKMNLECGVGLLAELQARNTDLEYILNSYNMGERGYKAWLSRGNNPNREYSKSVIKYIKRLKGE